MDNNPLEEKSKPNFREESEDNSNRAVNIETAKATLQVKNQKKKPLSTLKV